MELAVCAIFKNEAPYLAEWLAFHAVMGVEKFYLYNNGSTDNWAAVIKPWLDMADVTIWPGPIQQLHCYHHGLMTALEDKVRWLAFIDVDEFLWSPVEDCLASVLERFSEYPGVAAHWMTFGPSGHEKQPKGLTLENYTHRPPGDFKPNGHVKSVVRPELVRGFIDPHRCLYRGNLLAVDEEFNPVGASCRDYISHKRLRVNHYFTRSVEEWKVKCARGRADYMAGREEKELEGYLDVSVHDTAILRHVPSVARELEKRYCK